MLLTENKNVGIRVYWYKSGLVSDAPFPVWLFRKRNRWHVVKATPYDFTAYIVEKRLYTIQRAIQIFGRWCQEKIRAMRTFYP